MFCGLLEVILLVVTLVGPIVFWVRISWQRTLGDNGFVVLLAAVGHALLLALAWGMVRGFHEWRWAEVLMGEHVVLVVTALLIHGARWGARRRRGPELDESRGTSEIESLSQFSLPLLLVVTTAVGLTMALGRILDPRGTLWFALGIGNAALSYGSSLVGRRWPRPWAQAATLVVFGGASALGLSLWAGNRFAYETPPAHIAIMAEGAFWIFVKSGIVCIVQAAIECAKQDDRPPRRSPPDAIPSDTHPPSS